MRHDSRKDKYITKGKSLLQVAVKIVNINKIGTS